MIVSIKMMQKFHRRREYEHNNSSYSHCNSLIAFTCFGFLMGFCGYWYFCFDCWNCYFHNEKVSRWIIMKTITKLIIGLIIFIFILYFMLVSYFAYQDQKNHLVNNYFNFSFANSPVIALNNLNSEYKISISQLKNVSFGK